MLPEVPPTVPPLSATPVGVPGSVGQCDCFSGYLGKAWVGETGVRDPRLILASGGPTGWLTWLSEQGNKSLWVDPLAPPEMPGTGWSEEVWGLHRPFRGRMVKGGDGCSLRTCQCEVLSP